MREVDVAVVGAGPAGSATALALRRLGCSVALLEKRRFPRDKICGDFLTPGSVALLREIDPGLIEAEGPVALRGMRITFEGRAVLSDFPQGRNGWSLARRRLDAALASHARSSGVEVASELRVERMSDVEPGGRGGRVVEGRYPDGTRASWRARLVVEAGGRHGLIARRLGWRTDDARLVRYALWSHMEGVRGLGDRGEMHVFRGGYAGVAALDPSAGVANVTMVLAPEGMAIARGDVKRYFLETLRRHPELGLRCRDARLLTPVKGLGPLACRSAPIAGGAVALVGDACGFIDPFTGEGIYVALSSAGMLAHSVERHGLDGDAALAAYEREYRRSFASKFRLCRALQAVIARPWIARHMARALASRKELADRMVGATGDILPAGSVLGPGYIGRLLLAGMLG